MTNRNNPTGGKAIGSFNAARFDLKVNKYVTSVSDATPIYRGDAVKTTGTSAVDGTPVCAKALAGESIRGLVVSVEPTHDDENFEYRKASTERIIHVCDDPYIMLEIQTNGTLAITDIGKYANIVLNGGNDITGLSGTMVDLSSTSTDSRQLRIVSLVDRVDNEVGQYAKVRCVIHDHELAHGGSYTQENIWKRVGTTISPYTAGDDIDLGTGDVYIGGKLTVVGLIDPTGLLLDPQAAAPGTDDGMIYYDLPSNTFLFRENGAWHTLDDTGVWKRFTGTPNYLLPLVPADDIGATAARITKGWFTDVEATNMYTVGGTSINANAVLDLTSGEVTQLAKIGATVIALTSWQILGAANQSIATFDSPTFVGATLSGLTTANGIVQTDGAGVLSSSITLPDGTLATTQTPLDNSTKLATTAYVDAAVVVENLWDRTGTTLSPYFANDDVLITKSTTTAADYGLKIDLTATADVALDGIVSEVTAYASGMALNNELVGFKAILNNNASDTAGQYIGFKAEDYANPSANSPSYSFWGGKNYDIGLFLETGIIYLNDNNPDRITGNRETVGDGPSLTLSAADGKQTASEARAGGDLILAAGLGLGGGLSGEIQFSDESVLRGKFGTDDKFYLKSGTGIDEIVTSISAASTDDQGVTAKSVWDAISVENIWDRVTGTPNYVIPYVNADDIGATGARITKGWFTDLEITNMPTVSGTSINANAVLDLTSAEVTQLANIDTTTISTTQWDFVGAMDQGVGTAINVSFASVTTDNLTMDGNMISSSSGDIQLDPTTNVRINTLTTAGGIVQTSVTGILSSSVTLPDGTLATTQSPADNSTKLATTAYVDAAVVIENLWDRVTGTPNYLLPHTAADDIGATAARITKGWFANLEITNMPTVSGTSINANAVLDLASAEVTQLATIGSTTISAGQWAYLGAMNQGVATTDSLSLTGLTVSGLTTANGIVQTNGSGVLSSSITLPDGTLATTQLPADNSTKLATTAYVDAAVTAEDYWDRDATGTPFILPHNAGDHLHLNDGESTSFATSEFQIFKNSAPDASLWSASATASVDANLNLIRSRGTIASPTAVTDDDLIGNINFIAYSGSAFNNGAEIRAEINGAVSAGVLPCDMVFHVNAGAGTATEGMRLLKTKDLTVVGSVTAASVVVDNLLLDANTLSSTSGNLSLTPVAGSGVIIDSHWSFDANALTSLTDNNTIITAYAGKAISVESVTFDGGVVAGIIDLTVSFVNITSGAISTTLGNLSLTPVAGSSVIIDSHFGFDGTVLTALTDNNTTITAYAGKNITIEGTTFDGGTVAGITSLTIDGVQIIKRTASAVDYNPSVLTTDYLIVITDATAPRAVTISTEDIQSGSTANPRIFVVKDQSGGAGVNSITVSGETGTIDGAASVAIAQNYASLTIYADGTNLFIY